MSDNSATPRPRPARPQPGPALDGEPALPTGSSGKGPGLLATFRRQVTDGRRVGRGASVGAIAVGVALFAVAAVTGPVVAENAAKPRGAVSQPAQALPTAPGLSTSPVAVAVPRPTGKAPADPGAISALAKNGIPKVALNAYRVAAARVNNSDTDCNLHWSLLAGIGRAESDHGRFRGSKLRTDGVSTPPIVGPALNGTDWEYFKADPAYVKVTGDSKYAHAMGPMQFIPSTWRTYGSDANGDKKADVFNVNDAALAAARYLCVAGGDLSTQAGRARAVNAYNHNDTYVAQVLALADAYKRGVPVTGIPVGNITGKLPEIGRTGSLPPVNPANPTASDNDPKTKAKPKSPAKTTKPGTGGSKGSGGGAGSGGGGGGTGNGGATTAPGGSTGGGDNGGNPGGGDGGTGGGGEDPGDGSSPGDGGQSSGGSNPESPSDPGTPDSSPTDPSPGESESTGGGLCDALEDVSVLCPPTSAE